MNKDYDEKEITDLLAKVPPPPAPPWFDVKLMARIKAESEKTDLWKSIFALPIFRPALAVVFAAAAIMVVTGIYSIGPLAHQADEPVFTALETFADYTEEFEAWGINLL
jgi:hypothetical protein